VLYAGFGKWPPVGGAYACPGPIPPFGPVGAIPPFNPAFGTFGPIPPFGPMGAIPPFNPYFGTYHSICAVPGGFCPGCV
jgi:hypothetical protein